MAKRIFILALLLILPSRPDPAAAERPTLAVLPFGVARNRGYLRWLGPATASSLTEKFRRVPSVRVLSLSDVLRELKAAGIKPEAASWAPSTAAQPLGRWLGATVLVVGALGAPKDRAMAEQILQVSEPFEKQKGTDIWLAVRAIDIKTGNTLHRAYVEGRVEEVFDLHNALLMHLGQSLRMTEALSLDAVRRPPTHSFRAYRRASEAERLLLKVHDLPEGKARRSAVKRALKATRKALDADPQYAAAHAFKGTLLALQNMPDEAAAAYGRASALDPDFSAPRYGLADLASLREDRKATADALEAVVRAVPWDDGAHHLRGRVYGLMGDTERALIAFERALQLHRDRPGTLFEVGRLYTAHKRADEAVRALKRAVELVPGEAVYHTALAAAHTAAGHYEKAREAFGLAETLGAVDADLLLGKAQLNVKTGRLDEAVDLLKQVLQQRPEQADVHTALGMAYTGQNRFKEAVEAFQKAIALHASLPEVAVPLAAGLEALGNPSEAEAVYRQALDRAPDRADIRLRLVRRLTIRGDRMAALEELQKAVEIEPRNGDVHMLLGDLYTSQGQVPPAIRHYERALELEAGGPETAAALGRLYLDRGQANRARETYRKALDAGHPDLELYAGLGASEETLGNRKAALSAYRQALKIDPAHPEALSGSARMEAALRPPPPPPGPEVYARRGRAHFADGDLKGAEAAFRRAVRLAPTNAGFQNDLGTVYAKLGDFERAETAFKKAVQLEPEAPEGHYNLGRLYGEMGLLEEATAAYRQALKIDPAFESAQVNLGAVYLAQGEAEAAVATFQKALERNPDNAGLHLHLGNAYLEAAAFDRAVRAYRTVQDRTPRSPDAEVGLGNVAFARGDTATAVAHYKEAVSLAPEDPTAYINLGSAYTAQGRLEAAVAEYQRALELAPRDPAIYLNLAVLYYRSEQYSEARNYCQIVLERDPDAFGAQQMLGIIAQAMGDHQAAVDAYRLALSLRPNSPDAHLGLAAAYEALGNAAEALQHWQRWLTLVREDPAYQQEVERISERIKRLAES